MAGFLRSDAKRTYCFARALAVLAEQARNRDHHSSDPRGQASKQQKVAQEKRHTPASPITSPVQGYVDIPTYFSWFDAGLTNDHELFRGCWPRDISSDPEHL
jgi:hypothetical protein